MGTTIKLKSKATGSGAPTTLAKSEPAFDLANKRLYTASDAVNTIIEVGTEPSQLTCTGTVAFTGATTVKSFTSHTIKDDESTDTDPSAIEIKPIAGLASLYQSDFLDLSTKSAPSTSESNNSMTITYRPTFMGTAEATGSFPSQIAHIWNYSDHYPDAGGAALFVESPRYGFQQYATSDTISKGATNWDIYSYSPLPRDDGFSTGDSRARIRVTGTSGFDDESLVLLQADSIALAGGLELGNGGENDVSGSLSLNDWEYFGPTLVILNLTGNTTLDMNMGFAGTYQNFMRLRVIRNGYTFSITNVDEWIDGAPTFNQNVHYLELVRFYNTKTARHLGSA
jgi:hypothetical protein